MVMTTFKPILNEKVGYHLPSSSGVARMRRKRPWPPRNKFAQIFASAFYQFSAVIKQTEVTVVLTTSLADYVTVYPFPKKIGCVTAR